MPPALTAKMRARRRTNWAKVDERMDELLCSERAIERPKLEPEALHYRLGDHEPDGTG